MMANSLFNCSADNSSNDSTLLCMICHERYTDPYCTPCDHIFCRKCISEENRIRCPRCDADISQRNFRPASRVIVDLINRAHVTCNLCGLSGVCSEKINDHLQTSCEKAITTCSAADIQCSWRGTRDTLNEHLLVCGFQSLRSLIIQLRNENGQLKKQLNTFQQHCLEQNEQTNQDVQAIQDSLSISHYEFQEKLTGEERKLAQQQSTLNDLTSQIETLKTHIDVLRIQCVRCTEEKDLITRIYREQEDHLKHLTKKMNIMASFIGYHNTALIERIAQCDQRLMQLNDMQLNDQDMFIVVHHAMINKQYEILNLQSNDITEKGIQILANGLATNQVVKTLLLHHNRLLDDGIFHLAKSLAQNTSLLTLELESNGITNVGAKHLADMLRQNSTLESLYLSDNQIGSAGVQDLADAIVNQNRTLTELVLDQNRLIDDLCLDSLISLLERHQTLMILRLYNCNLSETAKNRLHEKAQLRDAFTLLL